MEAALEAPVEQNSFSANREGGQRAVRLLEDVFGMPGLELERIGSERFADHPVMRTTGNGARPSRWWVTRHRVSAGGVRGLPVDDFRPRRGPGVLDMKGGLWSSRGRQGAGDDRRLERVPPPGWWWCDERSVSPEGAPLIRSVVAGCRAALVSSRAARTTTSSPSARAWEPHRARDGGYRTRATRTGKGRTPSGAQPLRRSRASR